MRPVPFTEFRKNASKLLDRVEKGETIQIQRHGRTVARMIPVILDSQVPAWKRPYRPLVIPGAEIAQALLEDRKSRD